MHFQVIRVLQDIQSNRWHLLRTIPRFLEKDRERKICWKRDMFAPYRNSENQNAPNRLENEHDWTPSYIFVCSMIRKKKSKHVYNKCGDLQGEKNLIRSHPFRPQKTLANQQIQAASMAMPTKFIGVSETTKRTEKSIRRAYHSIFDPISLTSEVWP